MSTVKTDVITAVSTNGDLSLDGLGTGGVSIASTLKMTKGGDIASASPLVIDTDGNYFDVTGTTNFAAMTVEAGNFFMLQFDGALTITHGSGIELPGAANLTTAAGDRLICYATAADTVEVMNVATEAAAAGGGFSNSGYNSDHYYVGIGWNETGSRNMEVFTTQIYFNFFYVHEETTFTRIGTKVTTAVSAKNIRLGIYNAADGIPTSLITDSGTVSAASVALVEITISETLSPGMYFLALHSEDSGIFCTAVDGLQGVFDSMIGIKTFGTSYAARITETRSYQALPSDAGTLFVGGEYAPLIWLRNA